MADERKIAESLMLEIKKFVPFKADCWTLICDFYQRCYGIALPRYEYHSIKQEKPPQEVWKDWRVIEKSEAKAGDAILLYPVPREMHLGVVLDNGDFIHLTCTGNPPGRIGKISEIAEDIRVRFARYRQRDHS